jgi:CRP/FNR family cyclic AMP-dependent transcriptional regulator
MLSTVEKILFLKSVDLFCTLPGNDLAHIAMVTEEIDVEDGEQFIVQGEQGDALFLVIDGSVRIHVRGVGDVATLGESDMVGEMSILDSEPRTADCFASGQTTLLKLRKGEFDDILSERPEIGRGIIKVLTERLRTANAK